MMYDLSDNIVRLIGKELKSLNNSPLEGITVLPNEMDLSEINAIILGPCDTPYEGGEFRVRLKIGNDFPQAPPKGYFLTKIFHPNVSDKGEICVNTLKKDWKESFGLKHILLTVKCLLIVPNPESSLNEEAGRLLLEHYDDYFQRAKIYTSIHAKPSSTTPTPTNNAVDNSTALPEDKKELEEDDPGEKENQDTTHNPNIEKKPLSVGGDAKKKKKPANTNNKKRGVKRL